MTIPPIRLSDFFRTSLRLATSQGKETPTLEQQPIAVKVVTPRDSSLRVPPQAVAKIQRVSDLPHLEENSCRFFAELDEELRLPNTYDENLKNALPWEIESTKTLYPLPTAVFDILLKKLLANYLRDKNRPLAK